MSFDESKLCHNLLDGASIHDAILAAWTKWRPFHTV